MSSKDKVRRLAEAYGVTRAEFVAAAVAAYDPAKAKLKQTRGKRKAAQ